MAAHRQTLHYRSRAGGLRDDLKKIRYWLRRWSVEGAIWTFLLISWAICVVMVGVVLFRVFMM